MISSNWLSFTSCIPVLLPSASLAFSSSSLRFCFSSPQSTQKTPSLLCQPLHSLQPFEFETTAIRVLKRTQRAPKLGIRTNSIWKHPPYVTAKESMKGKMKMRDNCLTKSNDCQLFCLPPVIKSQTSCCGLTCVHMYDYLLHQGITTLTQESP